MDAMEQFIKQNYLNLETFRRNGERMKTPVWFVQDGKILYISALANSGKVKRIRNNGMVNIAACKMNGKVIGAWIPAQAREITDPKIVSNTNILFERKYGLMKKLFDNQRTNKGAKDILLEISVSE